MWHPETISPPAQEPLDLATEVAQACRLSSAELAAQGAFLALKVKEARQACEDYTKRRLITQGVLLTLDSWCEPGLFFGDKFSGYIALPYPPAAVLLSVKYDDPGDPDTEITMSSNDYLLTGPGPETARGTRARLSMAPGLSWPSVYPKAGAIRISVTVGYGLTYASIPEGLKAGMLVRVAEGYARREEATSGTIQSANQRTAEACWRPFRDETWPF